MNNTKPRMIFRGDHKGFYKTIYYPISDKPVTLYTSTVASARKFIEKQEERKLDISQKMMFKSINSRSQK